MRLNGDCFSVMDNGCICVVVIVGLHVYMSRVTLINEQIQMRDGRNVIMWL